MATTKAGTALALAREIIGPLLKEKGYSAGRRSGPGVEWDKRTETGRFSFGVHASPWDEVTGGRLQVDFGGDVLNLVYSPLLHYLPDSANREWQEVARTVFDRALGRNGARTDPDVELLESRQLLLQQELDGLDAGYLHAFGWPWFDEQDVARWLEFIAAHFAAGEAAAMADARERRDESPEPEDLVEMPPPMVLASREDIAEQLWRYGEEDLAVRILDSDDATWTEVMTLAAAPPAQVLHNGGGTVDAALAYAAVEVLTGAVRPLTRKVRRPAEQVVEFWRQVGPERDRRPADGPLSMPAEDIVRLTTPQPGTGGAG